jgi:dihydroorotate dehydrogenase electron transfer subunit
MKQFLSRALEIDTITASLARISFAASEVPVSSPGQFFLVRHNSPFVDPYLRKVWFAPHIVKDRAEFWVNETLGVGGSLIQMPESAVVPAKGPEFDFIGALGHGFEIPLQAKALLIVAENAHYAAALIGLIEMLVKDDREVVFASGEPVLPENLIPPEVEYRVEGKVLDMLGDAMQWSEFLIANGTRAFLEGLEARSVHRIRGQKLISDMVFPCGVGACYTCALDTRNGLKLACHDGPVFDF